MCNATLIIFAAFSVRLLREYTQREAIIVEGGTDRAYPGGVEISTGKAPRERRGGHACKIAK